ncbi:TSUP family transporter [Cupriavidus pinatubonensis]|uniref:TSUP family transporter n=1 Tax=Cupriavidus pinatubonensis TaxID=248026 RepID=UPI001FD18A31|nr:TSUP family transporter [Cupriavidus pinatubonensis]
MIATPLLALFLGYRAAMMMVAVPALLMSVAWLLVNRRGLRRCRVPISLLPAIGMGASLGVTLQVGLSERVSLLLLASLLTMTLVMPRILTTLRAHKMSSPTRVAVVFGGLAGVTEAALNVGAPFMLLFGAMARLGRLEQLMVLNLCFALGKTIQIGLLQMSGAPAISITALAAGTMASGASYLVGDRVASRFSETKFRELLRCFLMAMVGALLLRAALL